MLCGGEDRLILKLIIKKFIKNYSDIENNKVREAYGVLGGLLGVCCNLLLFGVKLTIGLAMNSIAILSDAFNNLSDTGSSIVAIIGAKMSNRHPDKEHPFGHGRIEYISALIVSFIIMVVGFELLKSSFGKIISFEPVAFNLVLIIILVLSILVKVWMFSYNRYIGKKINSRVLRATAFDSLNDVIATSAVILSIIIGNFVNFPIDGIIGLCVSLLIMFTGFGIAKDTISVLLGASPSDEVVEKINDEILNAEGIVGVHDLIVHDYGPGRVMASAHAEVPDDINITKIHEVIDATEQSILHDMGIHIVIHMDPISVNCERTELCKATVKNIIKELDERLSIHDFRMTDGENNINLIFDLVVPYDMKQAEREQMLIRISERLTEEDSRFNTVIQLDDAF